MASMKPVSPGSVDPTAAGGTVAPAPPQAAPPAPMPSPDDTPMLTGPTQYPDEPITAGLPSGAGPGPVDPRPGEIPGLKRFLPLISPYLDTPDTPESVKILYRTIRSS